MAAERGANGQWVPASPRTVPLHEHAPLPEPPPTIEDVAARMRSLEEHHGLAWNAETGQHEPADQTAPRVISSSGMRGIDPLAAERFAPDS